MRSVLLSRVCLLGGKRVQCVKGSIRGSRYYIAMPEIVYVFEEAFAIALWGCWEVPRSVVYSA